MEAVPNSFSLEAVPRPISNQRSANPQPATLLPPATPNATANLQRKRTKSTNKIDAVGVPPGFERPRNPNEDIIWLTDTCGGDFKSWAYALQGSTTVICFFATHIRRVTPPFPARTGIAQLTPGTRPPTPTKRL
ncbi:hypothetical protein VOLCADRAFT_101011 [Volvox carteri f. nagariensis]|uniref:Uncharacterized protein n=1 Tax=Volvox carteri f. nagariensis TaxID=3068 RepID=D8ULJ0_VOLCA|nr:uncharacterized protein VOLCADRAFT_101011 [Volvox carteri f. nagariensis]EFJ39409.1 hypothetical protein VOLCADRAFT_101011 [Volvox carteri f. nagariensis]|eukprot:XP_002959526.1 hypothetical protein VOLCADRAFT_101011 [Volvox carteri f. nagariensis]